MAHHILIYLLGFASVVCSTQIMRRPEDYLTKLKPNVSPLHNASTVSSGSIPINIRERELVHSALDKRASGKVSVGYFTNWGIYARNFQPTDIVSSTLTHILYAFADVDPNSGNISLTDSYADEQKHFPGDSWDEPGNNLYGCLKQMYLLKMKQRNLKVLLSIGGWTYSQSGHFNFVTNPTYQATFVRSAVQTVEDYGLDGVDLDFEYPNSQALGDGFASLLTQLRTGFDQLAARKGDTVPYQITIAVSAGAQNSAFLEVPTIDKAVTYWNLMAYDYAGSWSNVSDDQANLYGGIISNVSTDSAVTNYLGRGATAGKITMGIPLYGRGFEKTAGIRQPFNGVGVGTWEAGVYDYKALPLTSTAQILTDGNNVASYSYDPTIQELISYDTPPIVTIKTQYILTKGMAGSMFWSLDSDKIGADSLIETSVGILGGLDQTQNHLDYPDSKWTNIANNMAGGSTSPTGSTSMTASTSQPSSSTSPTKSSSSPAHTPTSGSCAGVAAWSSSVAYTGGQNVTFNGQLWTAKWWTQGDTPGGSAGVWASDGTCTQTSKRSTSRLFRI